MSFFLVEIVNDCVDCKVSLGSRLFEPRLSKHLVTDLVVIFCREIGLSSYLV